MLALRIYARFRRVSYPLVSVLTVGILLYYLVLKNFTVLGLIVVVAVTLFLIVFWLWQHPGRSEITSAEEVFQAIGNGQATFLNVYSNY